jgi:hypothetical protein
MRLPKIDRILSADRELQPVLEKAREIRALAGLVDGFLPPDLACQVRVANFREGTLVVIAQNPAVAAKLRLLAPSLNRFLLKQQFQVSSVSLRVQPNSAQKGLAARQKTAHFSTHTMESLRQLEERMEPSPAREALARLLRRQASNAAAPPPQKAAGSRRGRQAKP